MGLALRLIRMRRGWTQEELARRSGVGKARISGYENGTTQPSLVTLERLLRALSSSRFSLFLLAELLEPAAGVVAAAELDEGPGQAATAPLRRPCFAMPEVWQAMLGALRLNLETSARLLDALERGFLDAASARGLAPE